MFNETNSLLLPGPVFAPDSETLQAPIAGQVLDKGVSETLPPFGPTALV